MFILVAVNGRSYSRGRCIASINRFFVHYLLVIEVMALISISHAVGQLDAFQTKVSISKSEIATPGDF